MAISLARAKRERAQLMRAIERDIQAKNRARLVVLRDRVRALAADRRAAIARAKRTCAQKRDVPTQRQAIAWQREAKRAAAAACAVDRARARAMRDPVARARAEREIEHKEQRDLRRIEAGLRRKARAERARRPGVRRAVARGESDDEVRGNIPPELVALFERVKRQIHGSDRMSRTEAFLKYAEEHPDEELAALEDRTDEVIRELERRQAMPNPKECPMAKAKRGSKRFHVLHDGKVMKRGRRHDLTEAEALAFAKRLRAAGMTAHVAPRRVKHTNPKKRRKVVATRRTVTRERVTIKNRGRKRRTSSRPPRRWFDRCLRSVAARKYARDPAAVCAAAWWRRPPREREAIVRRWERGSPKQRRTAVAVAKAERNRADGRPPRPNPGMTDAEAVAEYERTHWGDRGRGGVRQGRAADPSRGTATEMGELVAVVYRTAKGPKRKGRRRRRDDFEHEFGRRRPRLAYNEGGLLIVGGDYRIKKGGIAG